MRNPMLRFPALPGTSLWNELKQELQLIIFTLGHLTWLRRAPFRELFFRYYLMAGVMSLGGVATRASMIGAVIIAYVVNVVAADADSALRLLEAVVLREVGPVFAALIVMAKAGVEITGQLAWMRERGEVEGLALLRVPVREFLILPCLAGVAAATVILTLYFEILAVGGGIVVTSVVGNVPIAELIERFLLQFRASDLAYAIVKSLFFGLALGAVACHHGLRDAAKGDLPQRVSRMVMQSLFLVSLINAAFGYLVNGVLLFGILGGAG